MSASQILPYRYEPFEGPRHIRVLDLLPGLRHEPLVAELRQKSLDSNDAQGYEVLSYVWGAPARTESLVIQCLEPRAQASLNQRITRVVHITASANFALRHLRFPDRVRTLWIDAICINQEDSIEQGAQVTIMSDVYHLAQRVLVWLGDASEDSDHAMQLMAFMGNQIILDTSNPNLFLPSPQEGVDPAWTDISQKPPFSSEDTKALKSLFDRPYFERLWITQVIKACSTDSIVICGTEAVSWLQFVKAVLLTTIKWNVAIKAGCPGSVEFGERLSLAFNLFNLQTRNSGHDVVTLMSYLRKKQCNDPRDRVYAVLAFDTQLKAAITPDYEKTVYEVYLDATRKIISSSNTLRMLSYTGLPMVPPGNPSWMPDWCFQEKSISIDSRNVCWESGPTAYDLCAYDVDSHVLSVAGVALGRVLHTWPIRTPKRDSTEQVLKICFDGLYTLDQLRIGNTESDFPISSTGGGVDALCRTICAGDFPDVSACSTAREIIGEGFATCRASMKEWPSSNHDRAFSIKRGDFPNWHQAFVVCQNRTLFLTESGFLGLGPKHTETNDEVAVVLGVNTPLILRAAASESQHQLVGDCFYDQHMFGEALLGPLPPPWTPILGVNKYGTYRGFRNHDLDHDQDSPYDPRILALIEKRVREGDGIEVEYEPNGWDKFPLDWFRSLGIAQNVRYFELV